MSVVAIQLFLKSICAVVAGILSLAAILGVLVIDCWFFAPHPKVNKATNDTTRTDPDKNL